jgi:excisionase family DNA binding protein
MATDTDTSPVHFTVAQAAEHARVSTKTIRRWIASGRLTTGRAGLLHVIDRQDLERAMATVGPSLDSPRVPRLAQTGQSMSLSMSTDLLDRLERQAERVGRLEAELALLRAQLALAAPKEPPSQERPISGDSEQVASEPTQTPLEQRNGRPRAWWRWW